MESLSFLVCFISTMYIGYLYDTIVLSSLLYVIYVYRLPLDIPNVTITKSSHKPLKDSSNKRKNEPNYPCSHGNNYFSILSTTHRWNFNLQTYYKFGFLLFSWNIIIRWFSCSLQSKSNSTKQVCAFVYPNDSQELGCPEKEPS